MPHSYSFLPRSSFLKWLPPGLQSLQWPQRLRRLTLPLLMLAGLSLAGCGPRVMVDQMPQSGLPGNGNYAWGVAKDHIPGEDNPRLNNDIVIAKLQIAIDAGLAKRGFHRVDAAQASWLVHYHAALEKQTALISEPLYPYPPGTPRVACGMHRCTTTYGWGYYGPPEYITRSVVFHEGTLLVDILDAKTNKLVWRGTLTNTVNINKPLDEKELQAAIDKLMLKLPAAGNQGAAE